MTIRTKLTLWYAALLTISLLLIAGSGYYELVMETRAKAAAKHQPEAEAMLRPHKAFVELLGTLLAVGLPAAVLGIIGGWWITRRALAPVAALTAAAASVSENNLRRPLPRSGNGDELDQLTGVFNAMLERLDGDFKRTREFTLNASHELKTPLTIMRGELEATLSDEDSLTPSQRERCASQLDELCRLTRIVDSLTLLAKADADLVRLAQGQVRLDELVHDAVADSHILAEPHGIQVALAACEELSVSGERHRLRQLLLTLTDNAIKYNEPNGRVTLALHRAGGFAELTITNTGPGIPATILPRVFERFFRGDSSHNNTIEGCGLGLSIAQWIVAAHRGEIQVASPPGQPTTVTVRLPLLSITLARRVAPVFPLASSRNENPQLTIRTSPHAQSPRLDSGEIPLQANSTKQNSNPN